MSKKTLYILIAILTIGAIYTIYQNYKSDQSLPTEENEQIVVSNDKIEILSPIPLEMIASPVAVSGMARGYWYFEATFPITIEDSDGNELGQGYATADGEWMTEDFVPFTGSVEFDPGSATEGVIIFHRANPSGLPENDNSISIPITF